MAKFADKKTKHYIKVHCLNRYVIEILYRKQKYKNLKFSLIKLHNKKITNLIQKLLHMQTIFYHSHSHMQRKVCFYWFNVKEYC